jgi:hypothetical protein
VTLLGQTGRAVLWRLLGLGATALVAAWAAQAARRDPGSRLYLFAVIAIALLDLGFFAASGATI